MGEHWSWDSFQGSPKQREIMEILFKAHAEDRKITVTDLWLELSYGHSCGRTAVMCSVNYLEKKWGLIRKSKRHGNFIYLTPTIKAYQQLGKTYPDVVQTE
jgi:predicted transcriptional regulator